MLGGGPTISRRDVLVGISAALAAPRPILAQTPGRPPHVVAYTAAASTRDSIIDGLRERGWVVGRNVTFEWYSEEGAEARIGEHLAKTPTDVLVMGGPLRILAAMRATSTVPIVGIDLESDPVTSGFVKTLARPGGNVSGIWMDVPEIAGKQLQFLREVLPTFTRLGVLSDDRVNKLQVEAATAAGRTLGISLHPAVLHAAAEIDAVMKRLQSERPQALLIMTSPVVFRVMARVGELARESRLPSISPFSGYPGAGGLMAYGPDFPSMWRQLGGYIDRVLKGAKIGDLPVERPSKFTLVINLKTAKALGLTLRQALVLRADEVIQ
jgi:putative tryptophan/tyrosine transport system substrate-binding protein